MDRSDREEREGILRNRISEMGKSSNFWDQVSNAFSLAINIIKGERIRCRDENPEAYAAAPIFKHRFQIYDDPDGVPGHWVGSFSLKWFPEDEAEGENDGA